MAYEPEWLKQWREAVIKWPPKCCYTCEHYSDGGHCSVFNADPPETHASAIDQCPEWQQEVPF